MFCFMVTQCKQQPERSEIFIFSSLSLSGLSLARFKIAANILMAFAGKFFTKEIEDTESIMLFKLKSVLYPPDVTAINRRR